MFTFTLATPLLSIAYPNLQCRFGNNFSIAILKSSNEIECDVTINKDEQLSLWYSGNQTFILSSNSIRLIYIGN
jgi:hypothetical protein